MTLQGIPFGTTFRGFIMQGVNGESSDPIGTWTNVPAGTQGLECNSNTVGLLNNQLGQCSIGESCGVSI